MFGADGLFTFHQFLNINTYIAKSQTAGLHAKDLSHRAHKSNNTGYRYGFEVERLMVGDNFKPEMGFLRRENFRWNYALARFSPRPERSSVIRKYS